MKMVCVTIIIFLLFAFNLSIQTEATVFASGQETGQTKSPELTEASTLSKQVVKLYKEEKYDEALPLAKRALELRRKSLGKEDPLVGDSLINLGGLYLAKQQYSDAAKPYEEALKIYEKAYGEDNIKLCSVLDDLGWVNYANGRNARAAELFRRSLSIKEKALGPDHDQTVRGLLNIGRFHQNVAEYDKSLEYYERALSVKEKSLGPDHKDLVDILEQCSCAYLQLNQGEKAQKLQSRAYAIQGITRDGKTVVSGAVIQGKAEYRETPVYPAAARNARVTGTAIVEITIDETGKVIAAKHKCGSPLFVQPSIEAARKWRFTPTMMKGIPVKVIGTISFIFAP